MDKNFLRQRIVTFRQELQPTLRDEKHRLILQHLVSLPEVQAAKEIMVYLDYRGEVATADILRWGWAAGKTMAVPVTLKPERKLVPVAIHTFDDLQIGAYGIREPRLGKEVPAEHLDLVLVPGVAFDRHGWRLGYGGGYYDRFLPRLRPDCLKIGLAYDLQIVQQVPFEEHDIPLDLLVTETEVIDCKERRSGS